MTVDIEKDAKALLATAKAENAKSKTPEPKGAGAASSAEIKKTEDEAKNTGKDEAGIDPKAKEKADIEAKLKEAEDKARNDEKILSSKDDELDEAGKSRKTELLKAKQDAEDKGKSNVQKRFDELTAKIKDIESDRTATKAERDALKAELDSIKKKLSMTPEDMAKEKVKTEMANRIKKLAEEDANKPREDRREMSKDDLDEWLLEDYEAASEWLTRRSLRRVEDERTLKAEETTKVKVLKLKEAHDKSMVVALAKHPDLDVSKRKSELKAQGKTEEEIRSTIFAENPKYKLCADIMAENPAKYLESENGPELIMQEMERRLAKKPEAGSAEVEELKARLKALEDENARLKNLDVGIASSGGGSVIQDTGFSKEQAKIAAELGLDPKKVKDRADKRKVYVR